MTHSIEHRAAKQPYHSPALQFHGRFGEMTQAPPPGKEEAEIPDNPYIPVCDCSPI
jgi:hypothetical protein